jgi:trk system potassium uptake protein TrkH
MQKTKWRRPKMSPGQALALGFAGLIVIGGCLLSLPFFSRSGQATPLVDSLFTATSAICVTGLTTLNTAAHWNEFGQFIIMVFIEIGGLGFMMLPIVFMVLAKRKVSFSTRIILREALNLDYISGVFRLTLYILKLSAAIQGLGAVLLAFSFVPKFGWAKGLWFSVFHAVSSFCNAGFDLIGDSLYGYQNDAYTMLVVAALIIAGGLGFIVWRDVLNFRHQHRLSLHSKLALVVTGSLLVGGTLIFCITEKLGADLLPTSEWGNRLVNMFFLAVTPRTAGYASLDYLHLSDAGLVLTMVLMYIGGTSGSTAGGLKTTTLGILLVQLKATFKGRSRAEVFGRTIKQAVVVRALVLFFLTLSICILAIMILAVTETIPKNQGLEYIAFEVFSAFGTVGLTMGLTPDLTLFGKFIIISLMYIGRVGVMTVVLSLITRAQTKEAKFKYPEEAVMVG